MKKPNSKFNGWFVSYAIALALLPILLLITTQLDSPSDLLSPPSLSGTNLEIEQAFKNAVGSRDSYTLQYPSNGDYRSAFVLKDLDLDGKDEAIVFYTLKSDETVVRINILDKINDKWESIYDEPGYGAKILAVSFDDLNQDGTLELLTSWSLFESTTSKTLTIHAIRSNDIRPLELVTLVNQSYTFASVADMDSDGFDEVLVTWLDTTDQNHPKSYASLLKQSDDGTINQIGQNVLLDASVSSYSSLRLEKNIDGKSIAFLDAFKGEDTMITEVIWWNDETRSLVAPLLDPETLTNLKTLRSPAVKSADIDDDGQIEIPINIAQNGEVFVKETQLKLFAWTSPEGDYLVNEYYGYINTLLGCFFQLPADYEDNILAYCLSDESVATFYWTDDGETRGDPLFTLVVKEASKLTSEDKYTFKVAHDNMVIYGSLTSVGEEYGFTNDLIEKSFLFYDD